MYFTRKGVWCMFGLAFAGGSMAYFIVVGTVGGGWLPWGSGTATALALVVGIILWLKLIYISRIGMSGDIDWDDKAKLPWRRQNSTGLTQEKCCNCSILLWE